MSLVLVNPCSAKETLNILNSFGSFFLAARVLDTVLVAEPLFPLLPVQVSDAVLVKFPFLVPRSGLGLAMAGAPRPPRRPGGFGDTGNVIGGGICNKMFFSILGIVRCHSQPQLKTPRERGSS